MKKFIAYHCHYGFVGLDDNEPTYENNDMHNAVIFTEESAKRLLVDIGDPRIMTIPLTEKQIAQMPFQLLDSQAMLDKSDEQFEHDSLSARQMTANAMKLVSDDIDNLGSGLTDLYATKQNEEITL